MAISLTSATSSMSRSFAVAQKEISTSLARLGSQSRFQTASQDATSYKMQGDLKVTRAVHEAAKGEISRGMSFVDTADAWVSQAMDQLSELKAEASVDPTSEKFTQLQAAAQDTLKQQFNGKALNAATTHDTVNFAGTGTLALASSAVATTLADETEIDAAISALETFAGNVGGFKARLGAADDFSSAMIESSRTAEKSLTKIDEAAEMANFTENDIRQQAALSMMSQANMSRRAVTMLYR